MLGPDLLKQVWLMRRMYIQMTTSKPQGAGMAQGAAMEAIIQRLRDARTNEDFLDSLTKAMLLLQSILIHQMNVYPLGIQESWVI